MIVDSSALVAIAFKGPEHDRLLAALSNAPAAGIGAPTAAETAIVLSRRFRFTQP